MYLLLDIGGTKTRITFSDDLQSFDKPLVIPTCQIYEKAIHNIEAHLRARNLEIEAVCLGIAGTLNKEKTKLTHAPNLMDWVNKDLKKDFERITDAKVFVENDAALVGLGEATQGAASHFDLVNYITISTGIGGANIQNKKIANTHYGFEPGHQIVNVKKVGEGEYKFLTLEQLASGNSINRYLDEKSAKFIKDEVLEDVVTYLAVGIYNSILHWSPEAVVLGGGIINSDILPIDRIKIRLQEINKVYIDLPVILKSQLKDFGGLWGGMWYLKTETRD